MWSHGAQWVRGRRSETGVRNSGRLESVTAHHIGSEPGPRLGVRYSG
jgi:hypothetical protein